jgi:DNA-binding response OmpR family regulator
MAKILIVEDEIDTAKVLEKRLTQQNFEVVVALDAYQGIALIHKERPDLILLDLMLPAGGGKFVLENSRFSSQSRYIPVIVLSGITEGEYKEKILEAGVDAYLEKPYDPEVLIRTIREILTKYKGQ